MSTWTEIKSNDAAEKALKLAKGCYQRNLIRGIENLSGSTLKGKARSYGIHYARSRRNFLARVRANGVQVSERKGSRGARILVIG